MSDLKGGCHCGNIAVDIGLSRAVQAYYPRTCDCDFCRKHGASYLSDPSGSVRIFIKDGQSSGKYRQGNELADFLYCRNCGVLVAALYESEGRLYAAINANAVDARADFAQPRPVSPKTLSGTEKAQRWQDAWFANVTVEGAAVGGAARPARRDP